MRMSECVMGAGASLFVSSGLISFIRSAILLEAAVRQAVLSSRSNGRDRWGGGGGGGAGGWEIDVKHAYLLFVDTSHGLTRRRTRQPSDARGSGPRQGGGPGGGAPWLETGRNTKAQSTRLLICSALIVFRT